MNNHFYKWFDRSMRQGMASNTFMKVALMAITMLVSVGVYAQDKTVTGKDIKVNHKYGTINDRNFEFVKEINSLYFCGLNKYPEITKKRGMWNE